MSDPNQPGSVRRNYAQTIEVFVLLFTIAAGVALIGLVIWRSDRGYDFSDEGFYLNWIANPHLYKASVTEFGFIYHALYRLVGGDIILLRRVNILITLGLAWILSDTLLWRVITRSEPNVTRQRFFFVGVAFALSTSALVLTEQLTPSYNSLALQALIIAGIGIALAQADTSHQSTFGWVLIGVSGWLAFMAKPGTALALAVVTGLHLALGKKLKKQTFAIPLVTIAILFVITAWVIDGSVESFARRLVMGAQDAKILDPKHTISGALRWDDFQVVGEIRSTMAFVALLVLLASILTSSKDEAKRYCGSALGLLLCLLSMAISLGVITPQLPPTRFQGILISAAPIGVTCAVMVLAGLHFRRLIPFDRLVLALSFTAFPYAYSYGSNRNYWELCPQAAIFWVLGAVVLLGSLRGLEIRWRTFLPLAAGAALCTSTLLSLSLEHPYRQPQSTSQNSDLMDIEGTGARLLVPHVVAEYLTRLRELAVAGGFKAGDPMLDLTGRYPGALYALGARSVGQAWMIGGYAGSDDLNIATLERVAPDELRKAWLLTEPSGPRKLSPDILKRFGLDWPYGYQEVGSIDSPEGEYTGSYKQYLLKPNR